MGLQWIDYFFLALAALALLRILAAPEAQALPAVPVAKPAPEPAPKLEPEIEPPLPAPKFRLLDVGDDVRYVVKFDDKPGASEYVWFEPVIWQDDWSELEM